MHTLFEPTILQGRDGVSTRWIHSRRLRHAVGHERPRYAIGTPWVCSLITCHQVISSSQSSSFPHSQQAQGPRQTATRASSRRRAARPTSPAGCSGKRSRSTRTAIRWAPNCYTARASWCVRQVHASTIRTGADILLAGQGNAIVMRESARRYGDKNILCYAVDPGMFNLPRRVCFVDDVLARFNQDGAATLRISL